MRILYIADTASWHNALWISFFTRHNECAIFSDYKKDAKPVLFPSELRISEHSPALDFGSRHLNKIASIPTYFVKLYKLHREFRPDVLHAVAIYYGFLAALLSKLTKIPLVYTLQGSEVLVQAKSSLIYRSMLRLIWRQATMITGDSSTILNAAKSFGMPTAKAQLIQNGVDLGAFFPMETSAVRVSTLEKYGLPNRSNTRIIFSPRALTPLYNIGSILRAVHLLRNYGYDLYCIFAYGFGEEHLPTLKEMAAKLGVDEYCRFVGYQSYREMVVLYQTADVVVSIPSSDSSPKSCYEAMACRVPVVASDLPWTSEYFKPADALYLAEKTTGEDTAKAISQALSDIEAGNIERLDRAEQIVARHFSYELNMASMQRLLEAIVATSERNLRKCA